MKRIKWGVFLPPFMLLIACVIYNFIDTSSFAKLTVDTYSAILKNFGWLFLGGPFCMLIVLIWVYFSPLGNVVLGGKDATPIFDKKTWYFVALCTTIGCGIVFWAAAEPIQYYLYPPVSSGIEAQTPAAAVFSMTVVYNNWTLLPYSIYCIVAVMFAFSYYNMKQEYSLGSCITPLTNGKHKTLFGNIIDSISVFCLVAGVSSAVGIATLNLNGALSNMFGIESNSFVWGLIIAVLVISFVLSAVSGIMNGIKKLSDFNVYVYIGLLALIVLFGGIVFILGFGIETVAAWFTDFFKISLYTGTAASDSWAQDWPIFYMGSWAAWAPISGVFLGKISKGRTVKECIKMNLIATAAFSVLWFMIISGATMNMVLTNPECGLLEAFAMGYENVIYALFDNLPLSVITKILFFIAVFVSLVTACDSNTVAISDLCCYGNKENPDESDTPAWLKIVWGVLIAVITWIMMVVGDGLTGMKMMANIGGLPAMIVIVAIMFALIKVAKAPEKYDKTKQNF